MVVIEVAVTNKGTKAFGELLLLLFPLSEIESITRGPIITVVSTKALILEKACLLTKGEGFLNAETSF